MYTNFKQLTQLITEKIEQRVMLHGGQGTVDDVLPRNHLTGRSYQGFNQLTLWSAADSKGYRSERWLTKRQAETMGGEIIDGEIGTVLFIWRPPKIKSGTKHAPFSKLFVVFNIEQIRGLR
jgi:antirestriction protein ArdC